MNANLYTKKIEMTKSEAKAAGKIGSEKFEELRQYMTMYPGYEIQIKAAVKRKRSGTASAVPLRFCLLNTYCAHLPRSTADP